MNYNDNWGDETDNSALIVKDCNGTILNDGDTVIATKELKVKGGQDIKRGDKFKNIRLTDNVEEIESGKMVLRTEFFKKA
ncbi:MAG: alkylphosphonate utilization protein [Candidatus Gracilibacteria bacterium]|nr:alkylphosphonate utilization protein [Candidatus Gracilibacteria bacterium]